jgi:hypothetical protein
MTCTHINEAKRRINKLIRQLEDSYSEVYEKKGPYVHPSSISSSTTGGFWSGYGSRANWTEWYTQIINKEALNELLEEIESSLNYCNCSDVSNSEIRSLNNQNREERKQAWEERKEMLNQTAQERRNYENTIREQTVLIEVEKRENAVVRREKEGLQQMLGLTRAQVESLESQLTIKDGQLELSNRQIEQLRTAFTDIAVENARNSTEARIVREQLDWTRELLIGNDNRIATMETKIEQKQQQYEGIQESLTNLRIKYKTETADKDNELRNKEEEIKKLKTISEKSHKELLQEKLNLKKEKVEIYTNKLGIELGKISNLQRYYEGLTKARENHNQNDIFTNDFNITNIKQEILNKGVSMDKVQKICRDCEKIAKLHLKLGFESNSTPQKSTSTDTGYHYIGRSRDWKNIHSNFTMELVQEWKRYGFTYEQCADWINISPPNQQKQAIKEPAYYAWLRDIKQVDSYWVLNEGNSKKLDKEFFQWYQKQQQNQYQARQEFPTNNNF